MFPCICQTPSARHSLWVPPLFAVYIFGNPYSESTSKARLTADPGLRDVRAAHVFFDQMSSHWKTVITWHNRESNSHVRFISVWYKQWAVLLVKWDGRGKKKKLYWEKCPANQTQMLHNRDTSHRSSKSGVPNSVEGFMSGLLQTC